ncbi:hypothetical protein IAQ61_009587, partial [Plenodomus lingam]
SALPFSRASCKLPSNFDRPLEISAPLPVLVPVGAADAHPACLSSHVSPATTTGSTGLTDKGDQLYSTSLRLRRKWRNGQMHPHTRQFVLSRRKFNSRRTETLSPSASGCFSLAAFDAAEG